MAQYNGYVQVAHNTYMAFRDATWGNGYNVDRQFGNQCWDFVALLYWQYGRTLVTKVGGGSAADCWLLSRQANSQPPFTSLVGKQNIKRGDILVWNRSAISSNGHIAFADEDYNGTNYIKCYGQNQGQGIYAPANVRNISLNNFLGIFRNTNWEGGGPTPPEPEPSKKSLKSKDFPWPVAWNNWPNFN